MNTNKLNTRDIITITLLTLINVVIFYSSSILYLGAITVMLMPILLALSNSIVFFIIGTKVKKRGAIFLYCAILGILGSYLPWIIAYLVAGVIAEFILATIGYGKAKSLTISFIIIQVFAGFASTIYPYVIVAKQMFEGIDLNTLDEKTRNVYNASQTLISGASYIVVVGIIVAALVGSFIGSKVVKKHLAAI